MTQEEIDFDNEFNKNFKITSSFRGPACKHCGSIIEERLAMVHLKSVHPMVWEELEPLWKKVKDLGNTIE